MKRRTTKAAARDKRKAEKQAGMKRPGGQSKYARKRKWLTANGMWGFDVSFPKPWK